MGKGGSHPWVHPGPWQGAACALWFASEAALRSLGVLFRIKNLRKFSSNSENNKNRELALGILSIG